MKGRMLSAKGQWNWRGEWRNGFCRVYLCACKEEGGEAHMVAEGLLDVGDG